MFTSNSEIKSERTSENVATSTEELDSQMIKNLDEMESPILNFYNQ